MSYESKYLKYKNKYLALKAEIEKMQKEDEEQPGLASFFSGLFSGGGKQKLQAEPEETLTSLSTTEQTDTEQINNLFRQLGGAKKPSKKASKKSSKKRSKKSSKSMDSSEDSSDSDSSDEDDDFSSSDLDW